MKELRALIRPDKAAFLPRYFQTGPGEYAEGDQFLGVVVPDQRKTVRQFREMPLDQIQAGLNSPWHEMRLSCLFILQHQFSKADPKKQDELVAFYLDNLDHVNNWDLVDSSAPQILGVWLLDRPAKRSVLFRLQKSKDLWRQRVSVVATMPLVKNGEHDELLKLATLMLNHPHDLIHKATGWLLREMGMNNEQVLFGFLNKYATKMPRTMLRYSIEKLTAPQRTKYMN